MKARFKQKIVVTFIFKFGKCFRNICIYWPVCCCHRRLNKKPIFKQRHLITQSVSHKQLVACLDFLLSCSTYFWTVFIAWTAAYTPKPGYFSLGASKDFPKGIPKGHAYFHVINSIETKFFGVNRYPKFSCTKSGALGSLEFKFDYMNRELPAKYFLYTESVALFWP